MRYTTIFFDLDDTLYPPTSGLWQAISQRIDQYIHNNLNVPFDQISPLRESLYHKYGTTLRGLQTLHHVNAWDYLEFAHDVPLEKYVFPDELLRNALFSLPQRRLIFTNAHANYGWRILDLLGVADCFEELIDVLAVNPYCKPFAQSYQIAMALAGEEDPSRCVMIDDQPRNLAAARDLGLYTIRMGGPSGGNGDYHAQINSMNELPALLQKME